MLKLLIGSTGLVVLLGCSRPAEESVLVERCTRDGDNREACECMARLAESSLDPQVLAAMKLGAQGLEEEADAAMAALSPMVQLSVVDFSIAAIDQCGLTSPSRE
ncbi:hypothetical protein GC169_12570 [bacterium]|nr:hypothetical protein [bacterium]